jgi:hypothetical protein
MWRQIVDRRKFLVGCAASLQASQGVGSDVKSPLALRSMQFPVRLNAEQTAFVDQMGNPCFACGDAPQYLIQQLALDEIEIYLADRAARGFNILWLIAADRVYQSDPPRNRFGHPPFDGADFTDFNEPYWAHVDYVMRRCLAYGMTVLLMPLFVGLKAKLGYFDSFKASSDVVIETYGSFIGQRYKRFPNLIWLLGGDADPNDAEVFVKLDRLATAIKAVDPDHLMTVEASYVLETGARAPNDGYSSVDAHQSAYGVVKPWLDFNWVYQPLGSVAAGARRCYAQGLPCLLGEDWYELEHSTTVAQLRGEGYGAVLGGCTLGRLFGNGAIWPFNSVHADNTINAGPPTWQSQLSSAGSIGQQLLGQLFRSRRFDLLHPDTSNTVMTVGVAEGCSCARTSDGQTIIVYLPASETLLQRLLPRSKTVTIDISQISNQAGLADCKWYNPRSGNVTMIGSFANSGTRDFTSPDASDWVLIIDSSAAAALKSPDE